MFFQFVTVFKLPRYSELSTSLVPQARTSMPLRKRTSWGLGPSPTPFGLALCLSLRCCLALFLQGQAEACKLCEDAHNVDMATRCLTTEGLNYISTLVRAAGDELGRMMA